MGIKFEPYLRQNFKNDFGEKTKESLLESDYNFSLPAKAKVITSY